MNVIQQNAITKTQQFYKKFATKSSKNLLSVPLYSSIDHQFNTFVAFFLLPTKCIFMKRLRINVYGLYILN